MATTPMLDGFRAALAASPEHKGWDDALWALAYHESQVVFDSYTTKDLARVFRGGHLLADLSTDEKAEAYLVQMFEGWDDEQNIYESILSSL